MPRSFRFPRDFGFQLTALYLLLIIPFLITLLIFDGLVGVRISEDVRASDRSLAQSIAQETDRAIAKALTTVEGLSTYDGVRDADEGEMQRVFETILRTSPEINLVYRLDEHGIMLYHYPEGPTSTVGVDFSFRDYFQRALLTREPLISQGRISPTTNQAVATAIEPLWSEAGAFEGVVGANIRLENLSNTLTAVVSEQPAEEGMDLVILDSANQIIAHPDPRWLLQPASSLLPGALIERSLNEDLALVVQDREDTERLYTEVPVGATNWRVVVSRPTEAAFSTQVILRRIVLIAAVTVLLIGLFFWGTLTLRVLRPLERLAPISEAIGLNDPISPEEQAHLEAASARPDQIGDLNRSILRMKGSIEERMKEQATLLDTSTAVVSSLDLETVLNRILEQMGRLLSIQMYAVIALTPEDGSFRIRASRGLSRDFTEQLAIQPSEPDSVTMRALRSRAPAQVSDTETDESYRHRRQRARAEGYRAILAVPLNTRHAPPTALLVFHPTPHVWSHNEMQLLTSFANHAAMAIENAVLYERSDARLREQTGRLEALVQSLHDGLILSDSAGNVIYANRRVGDLAGVPTKELSGLHADEILGRIVARSPGGVLAHVDIQKILHQSGDETVEFSQDKSGRRIHMRVEAFNVADEAGTPLGRGILFHDVTADRELDRMRSSLVSAVSHELRTPLAAIKGYASTLLAADVTWDRASQQEFLRIISDESDRLSSLVNDLLDLSRIEAGSLKLSLEECEITETVRAAVQQVPLTQSNVVEVKVASSLRRVRADRTRLESILRNLIENAFKYAGPESKIEVRVGRSNGEAVFRVVDDGPGIPAGEAESIFESFYRIDNSLARLTGGAGLGLAICRGLVEAHGGRIWTEPRAAGACFAFTIPLSKASVRVRKEPSQP